MIASYYLVINDTYICVTIISFFYQTRCLYVPYVVVVHPKETEWLESCMVDPSRCSGLSYALVYNWRMTIKDGKGIKI